MLLGKDAHASKHNNKKGVDNGGNHVPTTDVRQTATVVTVNPRQGRLLAIVRFVFCVSRSTKKWTPFWHGFRILVQQNLWIVSAMLEKNEEKRIKEDFMYTLVENVQKKIFF